MVALTFCIRAPCVTDKSFDPVFCRATSAAWRQRGEAGSGPPLLAMPGGIQNGG